MGVYFRLLLASSRRYQGETLYVFTVQKPITHSANPASEMNDASQFVADLASVFWNSARNWPAKYGAGVREDFHGSFERSIEEVFEEVVYFLASSIDYALTKEIGKRLIKA